MSQRLLLQIRLVPFSISPLTAKGRLKHLCAFLVPSLWLINYVLPQRGHREAQRFLELGLRPRRPRLTAEGRPKPLCALLVPSLWLINYVLPQRGHREAQRFLELGLRPRRPRLTAKGRLKHLCAFLVPSLWLINYVLPQRGHREAQRFLELGIRPRPRTRFTHPQERTYGIIPACKVNETDSPA